MRFEVCGFCMEDHGTPSYAKVGECSSGEKRESGLCSTTLEALVSPRKLIWTEDRCL